jgi:hypothetical protein
VGIRGRSSGGLTLARVLGITAGVTLLLEIVIPWALSTRITAAEASAIASLRNLAIAQEIYRSRQSPPGYARGLPDLSGWIDAGLAGGAYRGYRFDAGAADANTYSYVGIPANADLSGGRSFYIDQTGIIRAAAGGRAASSSPPLR